MIARLLLGVLSVMFFSNAVSASSPSHPGASTSFTAAAHIDSLRRVLGIASHLQLEWRTSMNGVDTFKLVDNFNRSFIGEDWAYDSRYWEIINGELVLNANATSEWRYLATFKPISNSGDRQIYSVSYRWGRKADSVGIGEGAHALMIDKPSKDGSGYWLWRRTNQKSVWLYAIKNGIWEYLPGQSKEYDRAGSHTPLPKAGDVINAFIRNEPAAVFFDYYINGKWDATLEDTSKEFAKNTVWYAGVFIHGQNLNNQIDDFTVTWLGRDAVPPAQVTNLRVLDSTQNSIKLEWTMTGDNQFDGLADHLEIRYSTSPITAANFAAATLAANIPPPGAPGATQQFNVTGLQLSTKYYFALRVHDESGNVSLLSNVAQGNTKAQSVAQQLRLVAGCGQTATVGQALAAPVVVEVLDQYGLGFKGKAVKFVVTNGGGKVQNKDSVSVNSDSNGRAAIVWTMGALPGANQLTIRCPGLSGSPLACQATASTGTPANIRLEQDSSALLPINTIADLPALKVEDAHGNAVAGTAVKYTLALGGGSFVNGAPPDGKTLTVVTDALGVARASFTSSPAYGDTSKIMMALPANAALQTSLHVIAAAPDTLLAVSGDQQTALTGAVLPQSLKVRILDEAGAPAKDYPITFTVTAGGGTIGSGVTKLDMKTDDQGFAQTTFKLGPNAGVQRVQAVAKFRNVNLTNSPFVFRATATVAQASLSLSTLWADPASGALADSVSAVTVTVSIRDEFDNALPGKTVRLKVSGKKNYIMQPAAPTDANGEATAEIRSTFAELKTIKAVIMPENLALDDSVKIRFLAIAATSMRAESGDKQTAKPNERLAEPVIVKLLDKFGNPPKPTSVVFNVTAGGGKIVGPFVVSSDNQGLARVVWQVGPTAGENKLEARVEGLQGSPVKFTATANDPTAVDEKDVALPFAFALHQNAPNPFNPETNIHFELAEAADVTMQLFDLNGRSIGEILRAHLPPGTHAVKWNGRDGFGRQLDSGVYLYRLHARYGRSQKEFVATRKLTLLK